MRGNTLPVNKISPPIWKIKGFRSKSEYIWSTNLGNGEPPPTGYAWTSEGLLFIGYPTRGPHALPKILTPAERHAKARKMTIKRIPGEAPVYLSGDKDLAITATTLPGRKACLWELEKIEGANTGRAFTLAYFPTVMNAKQYALSIPYDLPQPLPDTFRKTWPGLNSEPDKYGLVMPGTGPWQVAAFDWIRDDPKYPQYRHPHGHLDPLRYRSDLSKKIFPEGEPEAGYRHAL